MPTLSPFAHPFYIFAKPVGASCNMTCDYCYYLEKDALYQHTPKHLMSDALLEKFIKEYIQSQTTSEVLFTWHGGEPLLRPVSFYEKVITLQQRYAKGRVIDNVIQTNGTLLNDQFCEFFARNGWLVGVSIDGPQPFHDEYRRMYSGMLWRWSTTTTGHTLWNSTISSNLSTVSISSLPRLWSDWQYMPTDAR